MCDLTLLFNHQMETQDYLTELFKRLSNTMNRTIEDMLPYIEAYIVS